MGFIDENSRNSSETRDMRTSPRENTTFLDENSRNFRENEGLLSRSTCGENHDMRNSDGFYRRKEPKFQ
jgi:hypothetical protein